MYNLISSIYVIALTSNGPVEILTITRCCIYIYIQVVSTLSFYKALTVTSAKWKPSQNPLLMTTGVAVEIPGISRASCLVTRSSALAGWPGKWCLPATPSMATPSRRTKPIWSSTATTIERATSHTSYRYVGGGEGMRCMGYTYVRMLDRL